MRNERAWMSWDGVGINHVYVTFEGDTIVADGVVVALQEGQFVRRRYQVRCDDSWRVRAVRLVALEQDGAAIELLADGAGHWSDSEGHALSALDGCIDVDISLTPLTNTLPIRRLRLAPGASVDLRVAYIDGVAMRWQVDPQRYTCLEQSSIGGRYLYESLDSDFKAEIAVDADGFVIDYPPLFRHVAIGDRR